MNKFKPMIYLLIFLVLNISCVQTEADKGKYLVPETNNIDLSLNTPTDTLLFTSGTRSILQDSKGNFWFGSHQEGVARFDGDKITYFTVNDGLSGNQIRSIQEDHNGQIWFVTGNGVSSYNGKEIITHTSKSDYLGNQTIQGEWKKTENELWFSAGNNPGVYRYDGQKLDYLELPVKKLNSFDNPYFVTGFTKGKENMLWIATYGGVFGYNGEKFTVINDDVLELTKETGQLHIRSILEDSKGNLWIGNNGIGVLLCNGDTILNFSKKMELVSANSSKDGAPSPTETLEHIFAIEEDNEGNIWFGDRENGAWKYDGKSIKNYTIDKNLKTQMIWDIYEDKNGNLLFAMASGGVYQFDKNNFNRVF